MKDRLPLYPGRVKLVPVAGQENVYDMTRADQPTQQGDPLNKATLLKDATAALFGLGADSVPDEAFAYLGKYAQHWWKRRTSGKYVAIFGDAKRLNIWQGTLSGSTSFNHYSDSLNISQSDGTFSLATDTTLQLSVNTYQNANQLRGKYFYCTAELLENAVTKDKVYFVPVTASAQISDEGSSIRYISIECQDVTTKVEFGEWEYVQSSDRHTYPDSGEQDGYEYQYLGIPFDNATTAPKITTGSYVGTETSRTISVSFNSPITAFIICALDRVVITSVRDWSMGIYLRGSKKMAALESGFIRDLNVSISDDGKTISWSGSAEYSDLPLTFNANGTYLYMAIHG